MNIKLPPGQQLVAPEKWPHVGEHQSGPRPDVWTLTISGLVETELILTLDQLQQIPVTTLEVDIHCVTRWSKPGVRFTGILLCDILAKAGVMPNANFVSFGANSLQDHSSSLAMDDALQLQTLIAWDFDGKPLPDDHGGPLRSIVPDRYFYKSVKWLNRIDVLEQDRLGFWESDAGYHNHADPWKEQRYLASNIDKRKSRQLLQERCFEGLDLRGMEVGGLDLTGLNAVDALLRDARFQSCKLVDADFSNANLSNANFSGADLTNASFRNTDLEGVDFSNAKLVNCDVTDASLFGASFVDDNWQSNATPTNGATLDGTTLTQQQIEKLSMNQAAYVRMLLAGR